MNLVSSLSFCTGSFLMSRLRTSTSAASVPFVRNFCTRLFCSWLSSSSCLVSSEIDFASDHSPEPEAPLSGADVAGAVAAGACEAEAAPAGFARSTSCVRTAFV